VVLAYIAKCGSNFGIVISLHVSKPDETTSERYTPHSIHASIESETSRVIFHLGPENQKLKGLIL
jgi:hypothetical protein